MHSDLPSYKNPPSIKYNEESHFDLGGSERKRIYLNNAASTWPKPSSVTRAILDASTFMGELERDDCLAQAENAIRGHLNIDEKSQFFFTSGCTLSIPHLLSLMDWQQIERILISPYEHHALYGPISNFAKLFDVKIEIIPPCESSIIDLDFVEDRCRLTSSDKKGLLAMTSASNYNGHILPYSKVFEIGKKFGWTCLLDAAQTFGLCPINAEASNADIIVFAGHKAGFGPRGIGGLYIKSDFKLESKVQGSCQLSENLKTVGSKSSTKSLGLSYCDFGGLNWAGAAGLRAGIEWIESVGQKNIRSYILEHRQSLIDQLQNAQGINFYGPTKIKSQIDHRPLSTSAISLTFDGMSTQTMQIQLLKAGIESQSGWYCAEPSMRAQGITDGALRLSPGIFNSKEQIDFVASTVREIFEANR
jgi:selenocysteine lyase/cysteine desulfurase